MIRSESDKGLAEIEKNIRKQFPEYEFTEVVRPVVSREGREYQGEPHIIENIYRSSSRVCRVRKVPLTYTEKDGLWVLDEKRMHSDLVYLAAVIGKSGEPKSCAELDYQKDFFVTADPIADDAIVKLYESFLDKATVRSESSSLLQGGWGKADMIELFSAIDEGKILGIGMNPFGFFQTTIDYEVTLGVSGGSMAFIFHVYYDDGMKFRKVEQMHVD